MLPKPFLFLKEIESALENRGSNVFGDGWENNLLNQFVSSIS